MIETHSGHPVSQRADELRLFIRLLKSKKVRSYLEVGARHGDTFFEVMSKLPRGSRGVAVDLPNGAWGVKSSDASLDRAAADLKSAGYDIEVIYGDSRSAETIASVERLGPFDAIFIDGDHRLPGVTADWTNYGRMAPIVAFHDIDGRGIRRKRTGDPVEVPILWDEIKSTEKIKEFIGAERGMGIGVVLRGRNA